VRWPDDQPGGWHLHQDVDEDYCRQIVSEARMRKPSGGIVQGLALARQHYLDAEARSFAAAYMVGMSGDIQVGEMEVKDWPGSSLSSVPAASPGL
jgi:hypothetical protein